MIFLRLCGSILLFLVYAPFAVAQTESPLPSTGSMLLQVLGALILVSSLIVGAAWLAKRFNLVHPSSNAQLKPIASLTLGRKEKIVVVEACGKTLLLGVGSGNVNLLCDLSKDCSPEAAIDISKENAISEPVEQHLSRGENSVSKDTKTEFSSFLKNILANSRRENNT